MKKLLSIVLAVAMMASMAFAASAAEAFSMMPSSASDFTHSEASASGNGSATVTASGDGFKVTNDGTEGWPSVYYNMDNQGLYCHEDDDLYLNYDFEVVSGATNIIVYFAGQNPKDQAAPGTFICLNGVIDPSYVNSLTGDAVVDVPVGKYSGSVAIQDLGYRADLKDDEGNMLFSGCKIFAVGGGAEVVVNTLNIGPKDGESTGGNDSGNTDNDTDKDDTAATTTTKKQSSSKDDNPKTGVESDAIALAVVAVAAAGVVTLSVVSKKAKSR